MRFSKNINIPKAAKRAFGESTTKQCKPLLYHLIASGNGYHQHHPPHQGGVLGGVVGGFSFAWKQKKKLQIEQKFRLNQPTLTGDIYIFRSVIWMKVQNDVKNHAMACVEV